MTEEIWKPVLGYEGLYEISNLGRLKSLSYKNAYKGKAKGQERILTPAISEGKGYSKGHLKTVLSNNKKTKCVYIHRLVFEAFNGRIEDGYVIDHIDGNPMNNRIDNLRQVTQKENVLNKNTFHNFIKPHAKRVIVKETGQIFDSIQDCARYYGICRKSVKNYLNGKRPYNLKLTFEYYDK